MNTIHEIKMDLIWPKILRPVKVVQGDNLTRQVRVSLYAEGEEWQLPAGHDVAIRYRKPDGTTGIYDTLPDGSVAWSSEGNTVSVTLCPQMLTVPGNVAAQVSILLGERTLSTFAFVIDVEADPSKGAQTSENYVNWRLAFLPQLLGAKVGQYIKITEVDDLGRVVAFEAVDAPTAGGIEGDLDMAGNMIDNVSSLGLTGPNGDATDGAWMQIGSVVNNEDGSNTPVINHYGNADDGPVILRGIAAGVEDNDVANMAQLATKLPQPSEAVQVGDYLQIAKVSEDGMTILKLVRADPPADGITPHIGDDGNWYIGDADTGVKAAGVAGDAGVGIKSISRTAGTGAAGTTDTYTITYTDGSTGTYTVYNGKDGADGYTPVRGTDYWTENDQAAIDADVSAKVAAALAGRTQLTPEFVNSIDECTDTGKLYVLPDGYIYAYMSATTIKSYTNQLTAAGYQSGYRLSSSGGESAYNGSYLTGYIPCAAGDIIRLKNVTFQSGVESGLTSSNQRVAFYDADKAFISLNSAAEVATYYDDAIIDDNGVITQFTVKSSVSGAAYFRLNGSYIGADSVITVNEEMVESTETTYGWVNTEHAFVPADYEDRIIALETKVDEIALGENGVPLYISTEAERVASVVQEKRTVGSLTFAAMSDPHVFVGTTASWLAPNETSVRDAGLALSELRKHIALDFVAMLGDYTYGASDCTIEQLKADIQYFRKCMSDGSKGIPNLWATGNHDINYGADSDRRMTEDELYAYITGNNVGTVQDSANIGRNYGYIDFANQKVRCIYLNSVDALDYPDNSGTADDALEITAIQTQWLADVGLDLSGKDDPENWQIVVLSHQPLNLYSHAMAVLEAHKNGTSGSVDVTTNGVTTAVSYDFTAGSRGEVIANIHGHNHNFTAKKIGTDSWLWRICIPNMDVTRNNEAATSSDTSWAALFGEFDDAGEPVYYPKTQGTATSTSFCVITIDRKNRKIHALHYGAGIDREIIY